MAEADRNDHDLNRFMDAAVGDVAGWEEAPRLSVIWQAFLIGGGRFAATQTPTEESQGVI